MTVTAVRLGGRPDLPLLVLGPSLGTSAATLWSAAAQHLAGDFQVVAWDLPGHGTNRIPLQEDEQVSIAGLAADVLELVDSLVDGFGPARFHYAGDSVGGAVGLQLLLDAPDRVDSVTLLCTGARIGTAESWQERADTVRAAGTPALVSASAQRWFRGPGFLEREPERGSALLHALQDADDAAATQQYAGRSPGSTYGTGWGRSGCPCSPSPGPRTWPRRRAVSRWSPAGSPTAGSSSSTGSATWRRPRRRRHPVLRSQMEHYSQRNTKDSQACAHRIGSLRN